MRITSGSDEQVLARAVRGDARAFDEIYRRYYSAVFGYCLIRLGDRSAAEDATQETFLKVSGAIGEPVENVRSWLFAVARNVVIDATRRRAASPDQVDLETALGAVGADIYEAPFEAMDVTANVFIALRRLPARDRKALVLREFNDASSVQIAEELGLRPGAVDVLLFRARAAFGRAYAEIAELPFACRQATEAIYREMGSGASERQLELMALHLAACPRCSAEHRRAHGTRFLSGFGPWLQHALSGLGLAAPLAGLQSVGRSALTYVDGTLLSGWTLPARAALGAVLVAGVIVPGVVSTVTPRPRPSFSSRLTTESVVPVKHAGAAGSAVDRNPGQAWQRGDSLSGAACDPAIPHTGTHPKLPDMVHHSGTTWMAHSSDYPASSGGISADSAMTAPHTDGNLDCTHQ